MRAKLLAAAGGAVLSAILATGVSAAPIMAKDGRFEADVSARQMSRIAIQGEKVVSVRNINDPTGPQVMIETDEATGEVFVGFDGDTSGRAFSVFLTTESGKTVQAVLHPMEAEGQSILVRLDGASAASPASSGPGPGPQRPDRRSTYPETLVAFTRLMFTGDMPDGVVRKQITAPGQKAGPFLVRQVWSYDVPGLHGRVIYLTNASATAQTVNTQAFLVEGVLAASSSHEVLRAGEQCRIFIVEEGQ
jgi:hypothetical protein